MYKKYRIILKSLTLILKLFLFYNQSFVFYIKLIINYYFKNKK